MKSRYILPFVLIIQVVCAVFFVGDILISIFGIRVEPINWQLYEFIEIGAAVGLTVGVIVGVAALRQALERTEKAEKSLRFAQAAFHDLMEEHFDAWDLTPAERDVAMFAIKGLSTTDMAALRGVSEGTIKAQTASIYRKAGVNGRPQLLSIFIDDLIADDV